MATACLTGRNGGIIAREHKADHCLIVPGRDTAITWASVKTSSQRCQVGNPANASAPIRMTPTARIASDTVTPASATVVT